jgi:pimeloyl-ACP methyl ester carboxylesterase
MKRKASKKYILVIAVLFALAMGVVALVNKDYIAVWSAPKKHAATTRSAAAQKADDLFWQTFHQGEYERIQPALEALTAAYLATPTDAVTAAHIAWLHNWRSAERARMNAVPATITDDILLARRYFQEAVKLNPADARAQGFLAGHTVIEGTLQQDEKLKRQGYFMLLDAIEAWPEFNLFTAGFVMSRLPADTPQYREGLEWQWRTLDECIEGKLNRANPDYAPYMSKETREGKKRACWNSWIAPHNFEGFFLNMGDMLVKAGDWQTAQKIYANAKLAKEYPSWPYEATLEERIQQAQANVAVFNAPPESSQTRLMIHSTFACMACHQNTQKNEREGRTMTNQQVKGAAGALHVDDGGAGGLPVVFVHSFAGDTTHWAAQLKHLRQTRRAVAFDLRGHGQSVTSAQNDYTIEVLATDLAAVVDELKLDRFVLVGHSIGGAVALAYAGRHPQRVAGLTLVGAPGKMPAEQSRQIIDALEANYERTMEDYWKQLLANAQPQVLQTLTQGKQKMPQDRAMRLIKATFQYDPAPALRNYVGPKLFITAPNDDQPYALHKLTPDAPHQVIAGTSHWLHMDKPAEFNRILDEFLRSIETRQSQPAGTKR